MKKTYTYVEIELLLFDTEDVIRTSKDNDADVTDFPETLPDGFKGAN